VQYTDPVVRLAIALVVAGAGCDVVFPPGDFDVPSYSLQLSTAFVGDQIEERPADVAAGEATYLVDDPAAPDGFARFPATVIAPDTWYAQVRADGASLMFRPPELDYLRIWRMPARDLVARTTVLRRADAVPAEAGAQIEIAANLETAFFAGRLAVFVVGAWVNRDYTGTDLPGAGATTFAVPPRAYDEFQSVVAAERWKITSADQVAILRYDTLDTLVGALQVARFDQGAVSTLTGNINTVPLDHQVTFEVDPAAPLRLTVPVPAVTNPSHTWALSASPSASMGQAAGPLLKLDHVAPTDPALTTATFGNPFAWPVALRVSANAYRLVVPPEGSQPVPLYAGLSSVAEAVDGAPANLSAPIPTSIAIGATQLDTDNVVVPIDRARPVEITATFDRAEPGVFVASLYALVEEPGGYRKVLRADLLSTEPVWRVPAEIFDGGTDYFIRVLGYTAGFPGIATGDMTIVPPLTVGYLDSGLFRVP
jgi:hypothetical protein